MTTPYDDKRLEEIKAWKNGKGLFEMPGDAIFLLSRLAAEQEARKRAEANNNYEYEMRQKAESRAEAAEAECRYLKQGPDVAGWVALQKRAEAAEKALEEKRKDHERVSNLLTNEERESSRLREDLEDAMSSCDALAARCKEWSDKCDYFYKELEAARKRIDELEGRA